MLPTAAGFIEDSNCTCQIQKMDAVEYEKYHPVGCHNSNLLFIKGERSAVLF